MFMGKMSLQSRHVPGGLYFGPPAWDAPVWPARDIVESSPPTLLPETPAALREVLERLKIRNQDIWAPALLDQLKGGAVSDVVLNLVAPQPESILPRVLTEFELPQLIAGLNLVRRCVSAHRAILAIPRDESEIRYQWGAVAKAHGFVVRPLVNRYPLGHPSILLRALLGLKIQPYASPADAGIILLDPMTCWILGCWIEFGGVPHWRPVELFTHNAMPRLIAANLGQPLSQIFSDAGVIYKERQCIINGMMAGELVNPEQTVLEPWIRIISLRPPPLVEQSVDCIRCGWCVSACPAGLNPAGLMAQVRMIDSLPAISAQEASACIDCGLCSYVCPSRLALAVTIHSLKTAKAQAGTPGETT